MVYSVEEIRKIVAPIAEKYGLKAVYLFGSYARGTATADSDIDLLLDTEGAGIRSLLQLSGIYCELEAALGKSVDLLTLSSLEQECQMSSEERFRRNVLRERVNLYAAA